MNVPNSSKKDVILAINVVLLVLLFKGSSSSIMPTESTSHTPASIKTTPHTSLRTTTMPHTPLRIVSGSSTFEGRVEVYHNGRWGTICDTYWGLTDATVACKIAGFKYGMAYKRAYFGQGTGDILLKDVICNGSETDIAQCHHKGWGNSSGCTHRNDAGVTCSNHYGVRLVNGSSWAEGRVEVYYSGRWGTVCDRHWDNLDAKVVCRMLGYGGGKAMYYAYYGQGWIDTWLNHVECRGDETDIAHCRHDSGYLPYLCDHRHDAGVKCDPPHPTTSSFVTRV